MKHAAATIDFLRSLFSFLRIFPASACSWTTTVTSSGSNPPNTVTDSNGLAMVTFRAPGGGRSGLFHGSRIGAGAGFTIGLPGAASHLYGTAIGEPGVSNSCFIGPALEHSTSTDCKRNLTKEPLNVSKPSIDTEYLFEQISTKQLFETVLQVSQCQTVIRETCHYDFHLLGIPHLLYCAAAEEHNQSALSESADIKYAPTYAAQCLVEICTPRISISAGVVSRDTLIWRKSKKQDNSSE